MTNDEVKRLIARQLMINVQCRDFGNRAENGDFVTKVWQVKWLEECCAKAASAALAALEARGMVVVPAEPTEAMKAAGWIDKEDVNPADIYCAMLAARPEQE